MSFETFIGLEIHSQLKTKSKAFCSCPVEFGSEPNSQVCPVCLGLPGSLPRVNNKLINKAIILGLSLDCTINPKTSFARKNYFYPDLPKGYQITQSKNPICTDGKLVLNDNSLIRIQRIHMEEDTAKSIHNEDYVKENCSFLDYNRAGTPLLEIITEPDLKNSSQTYRFLQKLRMILQYLNISDADMSTGSLRCDVNLSIRQKGDKKLGTKVEIKNLNSLKAIKNAIKLEQAIQRKALQNHKKIIQCTKTYNQETNSLSTMRIKETSNEYRYFYEPDLPAFEISTKLIESIRNNLPELPEEKRIRFKQEYKLSSEEIRIITKNVNLADYFENAVKERDPKITANIIINDLLSYINTTKTDPLDLKITPLMINELIAAIEDNTISKKIAKKVLKNMKETYRRPREIITELGLEQISDKEYLEKVVREVLDNFEKQLMIYRSGEKKLFGFFIGQVMDKTKGRANPKLVNKILRKVLKKNVADF